MEKFLNSFYDKHYKVGKYGKVNSKEQKAEEKEEAERRWTRELIEYGKVVKSGKDYTPPDHVFGDPPIKIKKGKRLQKWKSSL